MGFGVVDPRADHVGGQQIRRELQPGKCAVQRLRERLDCERLGQAGHPFEQHVAVGNHRQKQTFDQFLLTGDDPPHFGFDELKRHCLKTHLFLQFLNVFLFHNRIPPQRI